MGTSAVAESSASRDTTARCSFELDSNIRNLPVVRLFVGSVARQWGATEDIVSDLRVGASELAAAAMYDEPKSVRIEMAQESGRIRVAVSPLSEEAIERGDEPAADVVGGLFDDFAINGDSVSIGTEPSS